MHGRPLESYLMSYVESIGGANYIGTVIKVGVMHFTIKKNTKLGMKLLEGIQDIAKTIVQQ